MLDREALKKPGASGVPVLMADGQEWLARTPRALFVPDDEAEDGYALAFDLGPEYDALWDAMTAAEESGDFGARIRAKFGLYRAVLAANYDLPPGAVKELVRIDLAATPEGAEPTPGARLRDALDAVVFGRAEDDPKDGGASAPG